MIWVSRAQKEIQPTLIHPGKRTRALQVLLTQPHHGLVPITIPYRIHIHLESVSNIRFGECKKQADCMPCVSHTLNMARPREIKRQKPQKTMGLPVTAGFWCVAPLCWWWSAFLKQRTWSDGSFLPTLLQSLRASQQSHLRGPFSVHRFQTPPFHWYPEITQWNMTEGSLWSRHWPLTSLNNIN